MSTAQKTDIYPKNWKAHGYGWHNSLAMQSGMEPIPDDKQSVHSNSSGVSSLYPTGSVGAELSYGQSPGTRRDPTGSIGWLTLELIDDSRHGSGCIKKAWKNGERICAAGLNEEVCNSIKIPDSEACLNFQFSTFNVSTENIYLQFGLVFIFIEKRDLNSFSFID